jgi:hypothetical protein
MELRDSGKGLVQIKDDGTHAVSPATDRPDGQRDRVRVPVTWLRQTDG